MGEKYLPPSMFLYVIYAISMSFWLMVKKIVRIFDIILLKRIRTAKRGLSMRAGQGIYQKNANCLCV